MLSASFDPINGCWFLVSTEVSADGHDLHVAKSSFVGNDRQRVLYTFGDHVHSHTIARECRKTDEESISSHIGLERLQSREPGR
jgi:hypothetical protein